jgi:hypothetical protein
MIIGISGKIGSGKDTVGEIIQKLCLTNEAPNFEIKKFAGKLKAVGSLLTGIPIEMFEDQEFKKTDLPSEWVYIEKGYAARNMTVRDFLQKLGTEAMRDNLHTNVWINALFSDYKAIERIPEKRMSIMPNWIITDMRFPNEMEAVVNRNGITIRVNRTPFRTTETELGKLSVVNQPEVDKLLGIQEHPSEAALDDAEFDYTINNSGTLEDLVKIVRTILVLENIIDK